MTEDERIAADLMADFDDYMDRQRSPRAFGDCPNCGQRVEANAVHRPSHPGFCAREYR